MNKVVIGPAACGTVFCFVAGFAFSCEKVGGEFAVIGESVGIVPYVSEASFAEVSFNETVVVHGFAAPHVSYAVDAYRVEACGAAGEAGAAGAVAADAVIVVGEIADVMGDAKGEGHIIHALLDESNYLTEVEGIVYAGLRCVSHG